jgi:hypothetical protein
VPMTHQSPFPDDLITGDVISDGRVPTKGDVCRMPKMRRAMEGRDNSDGMLRVLKGNQAARRLPELRGEKGSVLLQDGWTRSGV